VTGQAHDSSGRTAPGLFAPGLPGETPIQPGAEPAEYGRAFSLVAFTMNRFIVDQMLRAARQFDNDTETLVLFGVLSHLNVAHLLPPGARPTEALNENGRVHSAQSRLRPVRIRDLVQITGRPRETIRRKLDRLEATGRVLRVVDGYVINADTIGPEMRQLSVDGVRRFMEAAAVIGGALRDAQGALAQASGPAAVGKGTA
jgi:hypothetical protein